MSVKHTACEGQDNMHEKDFDRTSGLLFQATGPRHAMPVLYLPGVHGDWTPQAAAGRHFRRSFYLIETAYPRVETWSIDDYAQAVDDLLDRLGIESAHVVGESFGSLVGWQFGVRRPDRIRSFTLLGGFTRPPRMRIAAAAAATLKSLPTHVLESAIDSYVAAKAVTRQSRQPIDLGTVDASVYPATRTTRGRLATANRMQIIQSADFRGRLQEIRFPVRYIGGAFDFIVPVRREIATLLKHLPPHCDFQSALLPRAAHMTIASHPEQTVAQITSWIQTIRPSAEPSDK